MPFVVICSMQANPTIIASLTARITGDMEVMLKELADQPFFMSHTSVYRKAVATALKPAASCVTGRRSNQLNYAPALKDQFPAITADSSGCPSIPKTSGKCRDRAAKSCNYLKSNGVGRHSLAAKAS